jgi:putative ABC transport system permease protein
VTGTANLQLRARDAQGFDQGMLAEVRRIPGVERAAPLLEQRAVIRGPGGRQAAIELASVDPSLAALSGRLTRTFVAGGLRLINGLLLPSAMAAKLGLPNPAAEAVPRPLPPVTVQVRGRSSQVTVPAILGGDSIGPLTGAMVGIMPLARLQTLVGRPGRITRILVQAAPDQKSSVRDALTRLARGRLTVEPAAADIGILRQAVGPSDQATAFFAAISALLGFLLAFNAMLLTAPERRKVISSLRIQGLRPRQLVVLVMFQATILGTIASLAGLFAGIALSHGLFHQSPDYLAPAFTLGTRTVVGVVPIVISLAGGILASCLAAAPPLLDLRRRRAVDAVFHESGLPGNTLSTRLRRRLLFASIALLIATTAWFVFDPSAALVACGMLAVATVLAIPTTFALVLWLAEAIGARAQQLGTLTIALLALRATTLRSLALAATGAIAVFGSVAIGGARNDLLRGIGHYTSDYVGTASLWVVNPADNQATNDFEATKLPARVAAVPGVRSVRSYQGGFLDAGDRRLWIIARPPSDPAMIPASQIVHGDLATATARLRSGGWATVSQQLADEQHAGVGGTVTLSTPTGETRYRVAATTTNLGWTPGAVILNSRDYQRAWGTNAPTALEVDLRPGTNALTARRAVQTALGPSSGVVVQTAQERADGINASAREGLSRLGQISILLLIAAVLAMAAAMGAAIWQRRPALAALRIQSFAPRQLWRVLLLETGLVLGAGCLTGAIAGIYGEIVIDGYLKLVTGFPVATSPDATTALETLALVVAAGIVVVAVPGWFASRAPPHLGLQE